MQKKPIAILLLLVLAVFLFGCTSSPNNGNSTATPSTVDKYLPTDYGTFTDQDNKFELKYMPGWEVYNGGGVESVKFKLLKRLANPEMFCSINVSVKQYPPEDSSFGMDSLNDLNAEAYDQTINALMDQRISDLNKAFVDFEVIKKNKTTLVYGNTRIPAFEITATYDTTDATWGHATLIAVSTFTKERSYGIQLACPENTNLTEYLPQYTLVKGSFKILE